MMNDNNQHEPHKILREYWEIKKGNAPYPSLEDIDSNEIPNIWEDCFIVEVDGKKFNYTYFGERVAYAYAANLENTEVTEDMLYPESPEMPVKLRETMQGCLPLEYEGALINRENIDIKFQKVLLPLGDGKVTHIIGAILWREF